MLCRRLLWHSKSSVARFPARQTPLNSQTDSSMRVALYHGQAIPSCLLFALFNLPLDAGIRNQPEERDEHIQSTGDPRAHKREWDSCEVEQGRKFTFPIFPDSLRQKRVMASLGDDGSLQNIVGNCRHQQHETVNSGRDRGEVVFTHPGCRERKERQPEQEMKVGPQNPAADLLRGLEQMMVVVPINAEVNEAQHVAQQYWQHWFQCSEFNRMRHLQFQHHDRDDDGKDAVAESFQQGCFHLSKLGRLLKTASESRALCRSTSG